MAAIRRLEQQAGSELGMECSLETSKPVPSDILLSKTKPNFPKQCHNYRWRIETFEPSHLNFFIQSTTRITVLKINLGQCCLSKYSVTELHTQPSCFFSTLI